VVLVFGRWRGDTVLGVLRWVGERGVGGIRRKEAWYADLPFRAESASTPPIQFAPVLRDQHILGVQGAAFGWGIQPHVAVAYDAASGRVAVTIRASGQRFGFLNPTERTEAVNAWGRVLATWGRETTPVVELRATEWAAPAGLESHKQWIRDRLAPDTPAGAIENYETLLRDAGTMATPHETILTLVVDVARCVRYQSTKKTRAGKDARLRLAVRTALDETRTLKNRLEQAGLTVSPALAPGELGRMMRHRFDPWGSAAHDIRAHTLGHSLGTTPPALAGPLATRTTWRNWTTDSTVHRAFVATEWPRTNLPADWFGHILLEARHIVRAVTVIYEPIPPSRSRKAITWTDTKLETDEAHRTERNLRVPVGLHRQKVAVRQREAELEEGHREFAYGAIIAVSAPSTDELDEASRDITEICATAGLTIRPLDGRHDTAIVATLPLARSVRARPVWNDLAG
jgi:hypothetical protein